MQEGIRELQRLFGQQLRLLGLLLPLGLQQQPLQLLQLGIFLLVQLWFFLRLVVQLGLLLGLRLLVLPLLWFLVQRVLLLEKLGLQLWLLFGELAVPERLLGVSRVRSPSLTRRRDALASVLVWISLWRSYGCCVFLSSWQWSLDTLGLIGAPS